MSLSKRFTSEEIQIRGEPGDDPSVCRFVLSRPLYLSGSYVCRDPRQAHGSQLLEALFSIPGITQAWVVGNSLTLQKQEGSEDWPVIGKKVGQVLREFLKDGVLFTPPAPPTASNEAQIAGRIQAVLDTQVNPGVAGHGGRIELIDFKAGVVSLRMSGGCQGCGAAQLTLRQGVEKALRAEIPEVTEVIDVTDHSSGRNPYFS